jgi:biotin carboxyl carrier protein
VRCPIAGTVFEVHRAPGDTVAAGDAIVTLECMKMEIPIEAPAAGRLSSIEVKPGDTVTQDQLVFILES